MLGSGRVALASFAGAACAASIAACSLVVDSGGLSGGPAPTTEGGSLESGVTDGRVADGRVVDGALQDAAFSCDGGTVITSFDGFDTTGTGTVTVTVGKLTASASTTAKDEQFSAVLRRDFTSVPRRLSLTYDLTIPESQTVYFEPGCSIYLENSQQQLFRQTFASNHGAFSGYLNLELLDGGDDSRNHQFFGSLGSESTHHIEILLTTAGTNLAADVSVDGVVQSDPLVLPDTPTAFFVRCGLTYGAQNQPGSFTTSIVIQSFALSLCP